MPPSTRQRVGSFPSRSRRKETKRSSAWRTTASAFPWLGIGLSIVKQVIALHGGSVEAYSEGPASGSRFTVRLPLLEATVEDAEPAVATTSAQPVSRRILVVDDNVDAAESLSLVLELLGHEVRAAFDGEAALREAEALRPEVVLLDIGMPVMDGMTLARHLRAKPWGRTVTLVAVTGWAREADREATREAGFDHHLAKPIRPDALESLIAGAPAQSR